MRNRLGGCLAAAAVIGGFLFAAVKPTAGQAPSASSYKAPRTLDGKPDLGGIWQVLNTASWDLQAHNAADGVPAGLGVVEGNVIPYQPAAAAKKKENFDKRLTEDPLRKCFLAGVPRITYMPFPLQIVQTPTHVGIAYEYNHASRIVYTNGTDHSGVDDFWMGDSRGRWEGETLVVDVTGFNDETWLAWPGYFHTNKMRVIERLRRDGNVLHYQVTVEDPDVLMQPWVMDERVMRLNAAPMVQVEDPPCVETDGANLYTKERG